MMKKNIAQRILISLIVAGVLSGCTAFSATIPITTPWPTYTPLPTYTAYPPSTPFVVNKQIPQSDGQDYWPAEPLSRDFYRFVDVATDPLIPIQEFREAYKEAVEGGDAWIQDPSTVALRLAGYPNVDDASPDKVFVYSLSHVDVVVVVRSENLRDDSIRDHEKRIDLTKIGDIWQIEWAGYRQRCYRSNFDGWITNLCP